FQLEGNAAVHQPGRIRPSPDVFNNQRDASSRNGKSISYQWTRQMDDGHLRWKEFPCDRVRESAGPGRCIQRVQPCKLRKSGFKHHFAGLWKADKRTRLADRTDERAAHLLRRS